MRKALSFTVLSVPERTTRLDLETRLIATLSQCLACQPSKGWLGRYSPIEKINRGKLWQVIDIDKESLTNSDLEQIRQLALA